MSDDSADTPIYDIPLKRLDGTPTTLREYAGKVLLVVNVASKCGLTPQYEGLEQLYREQRANGLEVLGFPANNYGGQEPGTSEEIQEFCSSTYEVDFPLFEKLSTRGEDQHPLYRALTTLAPVAVEKPGGGIRTRLIERGRGPATDEEVVWNFEKFVVGRDGEVRHRFAPDIVPGDPMLREALQQELDRSPAG